MISSPLMDGEYHRLVPDYSAYRSRRLDLTDTREPAGTLETARSVAEGSYID